MTISVKKAFASLASLLLGCGGGFKETKVEGVPNLGMAFPDEPRIWRMGQPPDAVGWAAVVAEVGWHGEAVGVPRILVVKLNDDKEGDDSPITAYAGVRLVKLPIPPFEDEPWSVLTMPKVHEVRFIIGTIITAYRKGDTVVVHCTHGRDRTSFIIALVGMYLYGWTKKQAWENMLEHGYRWELPALDAYFLGGF